MNGTPTMNVDGGVGGVTLTAKDAERKVFVGTMTFTNVTSGVKTVTISGTDYGDNNLLALSNQDNFVQPTRDTNGNFPTTPINTGNDTRAKFKYGTPFSVSVTPALSQVSNGMSQTHSVEVINNLIPADEDITISVQEHLGPGWSA